eukprot:5848322-Prymnesium_polylepis.1
MSSTSTIIVVEEDDDEDEAAAGPLAQEHSQDDGHENSRLRSESERLRRIIAGLSGTNDTL